MPDATSIGLFAAAALLLAVVPGPAVLYIVAQSVDGGRLAGLASAAGIATGGLVHAAAAALGLSSILVSSAHAFEAVKLAGAAYLVYLGIRRLTTRVEHVAVDAPRRESYGRMYRRGVVVNVLNPKTALFFLAFLPQFVDPAKGSAPLQLTVLGLVFVAIAALSDSAYALAAGSASAWLRRSRAWLRAQRWVAGSVFVGLGVAAALEGRRTS